MVKKHYSELELRVEDVYTGRWFYFMLKREDERPLGIFHQTDDYGIEISEKMIPEIIAGLRVLRHEFRTGAMGCSKTKIKNRLDQEIDNYIYHVFDNDAISIDFSRHDLGRNGIIRIDWTVICVSKMMTRELIIGLIKAQKMLTGDNF